MKCRGPRALAGLEIGEKHRAAADDDDVEIAPPPGEGLGSTVERFVNDVCCMSICLPEGSGMSSGTDIP
jgi:hypothetical protein